MEDWDQETLEKAIARERGICPAAVCIIAAHSMPARTWLAVASSGAVGSACGASLLPMELTACPRAPRRPPPPLAEKHGNENKNRPTEIICKFFLEAVEKRLYGWFWQVSSACFGLLFARLMGWVAARPGRAGVTRGRAGWQATWPLPAKSVSAASVSLSCML